MAVSKWGVLDRHDAETYPTDLSLPRWRWEFLRRSGAYRQDWERVQADPEAVDPRKYGLSIFLNPASSIRCPTPDCTGWSDDDFLLTPAPP